MSTRVYDELANFLLGKIQAEEQREDQAALCVSAARAKRRETEVSCHWPTQAGSGA